MNIGFDLDEILVSHPPIIPAFLIALLYRGTPKKILHYRTPGLFEKQLRVFSHHPLLRPILKRNLSFIKELSKRKGYRLHLISSRFSFLKNRTETFVNHNGFKKLFTTIHFNYSDKQPHEFKEAILKTLHLDKYIDDDLLLLQYLAERFPKTMFYWLNSYKKEKLTKNIIAITNINQMV